MTDEHDVHGFPAVKLGAFLRAMEDPEGTGAIDPERDRDIARIEERIAEARGGASNDEEPPASVD
jgi:hypothetical protein